MTLLQISGRTPGEFPRYEKKPDRIQKTDAAIKESINHALWKDNVLRALDYEMDVHVKKGGVYLSGHIPNTACKDRIENAIQDMPDILEIKNDLVLDDALTLEVAALLEKLERTYACKFFTSVSHGVVSLNGVVSAESIKLLAEKCAASSPNVRGVINNIRLSGSPPELQEQPFLQPTIGEAIYFLDGISGVVKQVIINPNNRRVIAMTVQGNFTDRRRSLRSSNNGEARSPKRLVILRMNTVRYLTRVSGFLHISSNEKNQYLDFDPDYFVAPDKSWVAPYPYSCEDVLFPVEYQNEKIKLARASDRSPFAAILEDISFRKQFIANDSYGGYDDER